MKTYQAMFIFAGSMAEDVFLETLKGVQGEVEKLGGEVTTTEPMGKRLFARPMKKMDAGFYAKLILRMSPSAVSPLLTRLKLNDKIFRVQIVEMHAAKKSAQPSATDGAAGEEASNG